MVVFALCLLSAFCFVSGAMAVATLFRAESDDAIVPSIVVTMVALALGCGLLWAARALH